MKKFAVFGVCVLAGTYSSYSAAEDLEIGVELIQSYVDYEEPNIMEMKGSALGIAADITQHKPMYMLRLEGSYIQGYLDYTSRNTGSDDNVPNYIYEIRGLVGQDLANFSRNNMRFTPYTGLGFRRLKDESGYRQTTTGHWGYDRTQDYIYLPVGVFIFTDISSYTFEANVEYDYLIRGKNTSEMGYIGPTYEDLTFTQDSGYGLQASATLGMPVQLGSITRFGISPYIKYWNIDRSDVVNGYVEPANTTTEYGIKIRFDF